MDLVRIDRRFRGPPDSGNGGYFAGLTAEPLGGSDVVVSLAAPAPLDVDLQLIADSRKAELRHGELLIAQAVRHALALKVPSAPDPATASEAEARFVASNHIYPGCFVCGPDRVPGDGLRIFTGPFGAGRVAAHWTAPPDCVGPDGIVLRRFLWAALDCPGYFAVQREAGLALLGRMAARVDQDVRAGDPLIVQAWAIGSEGRKHRAGTALHRHDGSLVACSEQLWVTLR